MYFAVASALSRYPFSRAESFRFDFMTRIQPTIPFSGVRISWLILDKNRLLDLAASCAFSMACSNSVRFSLTCV